MGGATTETTLRDRANLCLKHAREASNLASRIEREVSIPTPTDFDKNAPEPGQPTLLHDLAAIERLLARCLDSLRNVDRSLVNQPPNPMANAITGSARA